MEFIVINKNELKVILSKEDMETLSLNPKEFDYSKTASKHVLWQILDRAQNETGFDSDKCKLLVQLFSSKEGGGELYISKSVKNEKLYYINNDNSEEDFSKTLFYLILDFDSLYNLCCRISHDDNKYVTSLYYIKDNLYILIFKNNKKYPSYCKNKLFTESYPHYAVEYGTVNTMNSKSVDYLEEHYTKIAGRNAVERIASI